MITSIARQSVILKCLRKKSVLVGNYEFYYLAGLLKKLYGLPLAEEQTPTAMIEAILPELDRLVPGNEEEAYLIRMVSIYEPGEEYDGQMRELFAWGEHEEDLWMVNTSHRGGESQ